MEGTENRTQGKKLENCRGEKEADGRGGKTEIGTM